jgi:hypothetical protein
MWNLRSFVLILLLTTFSEPVLADGPATAQAMGVDPMTKVLPEVKFDSVSIYDALGFLQDVSPGFEAVVVRDGAEPSDAHTVTMDLKNVTVQQVLEVLQLANYSTLDIRPVDEGRGPSSIYVVRGKEPRPAPATVLRVYRLEPVIEAMRGNGASKNKPLDDILSLIEATLSQVPGQSKPTLQVHEETKTLIFKGSSEQMEAVNQALEALCPGITHDESSWIQGLRLQRQQEALAVKQNQPLADEKNSSTENPGATTRPAGNTPDQP